MLMPLKLNRRKYFATGSWRGVKWSDSHGVTGDYAGAAGFYGWLVYETQPANMLVIGSGAGFVPKIFLDYNPRRDHRVTLVDPLLPETGNGSPLDFSDIYDINRGMYKLLENYVTDFLHIKATSSSFMKLAQWHGLLWDLIFID